MGFFMAVTSQDLCFTAQREILLLKKGIFSAGLKGQVVVALDCSQVEQLYLLLPVLLVTNGISHFCSTTRHC